MGEPSAEFADDPNITDVSMTEWIAWAPMLFGIVLFGIAPGLIFEVTDPAVIQSLDNCIQVGCDAAEVAASSASGGG